MSIEIVNYPATYRQGETTTMHMDERDAEIIHRVKIYMADFSDWLCEDF